MARLSVVVPVYAEAAVVEQTVLSLERAADGVDETVEILLVLNRAVGDIEAGRRTRILSSERNLGFAGGVMRGLRAAEGEWIAVVNDDCVVEPHALRALLDAGMADPGVGSVAGLVLFADRPGVVNSAGIVVDELGVASERLVGEPLGAGATPADVFGGSGTFTLYRRAMLDELGGFDESFFAYLEDADLAWRAQIAGWRCVFEPAARAHHAHSSVLGHGSHSKHFLVGRNRVRMLAKNATTAHLRRHGLAMAFYDLAYVAYSVVRYRTLAPLVGRLVGLGEWRRYRRLGAAHRAPIALAKHRGVVAALRRDRAYRA